MCTWLITGLPRSDRVVLEANTDHWNKERGPRLEKVVFRNDIDPAEALDLVCNTEGEIDIVTEVSPADAGKIEDSEHAHLVTIDAMRMLCGVINRDAEFMDDVRVRRALNMAVDRNRLIQEGFEGYAYPLAGLAPDYSAGKPEGQEPYPHDTGEARRLLSEAGWPENRALRLAAPADLEGVGKLLEAQFEASLGIPVELTVIPEDGLISAQHAFIEKVLPQPFDVLVHAWFDLSSEAPVMDVHREFFHSTGAFRAGPPIQELEEKFRQFLVETDPAQLTEASASIDRYVYDNALAVFLCCPMALVAVNKHVNFTGHAATLELAETSVGGEHWSRK